MWREVSPFKCSVAAYWFSNKRDPVETSSIGGSRPSTKLSVLQLCRSPLKPAGLRGTRWLQWEEGVLLAQPWPKLGFHNLTKNNRERDGERGRGGSTPPSISIGVCLSVCLCVSFRRTRCRETTQYMESSYMSVRRQNRIPPPSMKMVAPQPSP